MTLLRKSSITYTYVVFQFVNRIFALLVHLTVGSQDRV